MSAKHVLLVEDDEDVRESLRMVLEDVGCRVSLARHGGEALDVLRGAKALPQLVLLDLMMPVMNGWQLLDALEADAAFSRLRVVVMTAAREAKVASRLVAEVIRKPPSYEQLVELVGVRCTPA